MSKGAAPKTFTDYLNKRLNPDEIQWMQEAAQLEDEYFSLLKKELNTAVRSYMEKNDIGLSKLARMLYWSDSQALRIIAGEHGVTMSTLAHIGAAFKMKPHIVFEEDK